MKLKNLLFKKTSQLLLIITFLLFLPTQILIGYDFKPIFSFYDDTTPSSESEDEDHPAFEDEDLIEDKNNFIKSEKLREILIKLDNDTINKIAEILEIPDIEKSTNDELIHNIISVLEKLSRDDITDSIFDGIIVDAVDEDTDVIEIDDFDEDTEIVDSGADRINITSPISGDSWSIEYDIWYRTEKSVEGRSYDQLITMGDCKIVFNNTILEADLLVVNWFRDSNDSSFSEFGKPSIEVMAYGNIRIQSADNIFSSKLAFFYPESMRAILYDVVAYFPSNNNFMLKADIVKLLSDLNEIIAINGEATTSYLEYPHYSFNSSKIWYYNDIEEFYITNFSYKIGQSTLFYFPFMFQSQFSSGISTDFRYLRGTGFYFQLTKPFKISNYKNVFIFDYYQRLGFFFKFQNPIDIFGFSFSFATAYDRAVRFVGGERDIEIFSNSVDINNDGNFVDSFNSFRYYIDGSGPIAIYSGNLLDLEEYLSEQGNLELLESLTATQINTLSTYINSLIANLSVSGNLSFFKVSDPLFQSQFIAIPRSTIFDISETIDYRKEAPSSQAPDTPGSGNAMSINSSIGGSTTGFNFSVSGAWNWSFRSKEDKLNPYDVLNYYDIQQSSISFPNFNFSFGLLSRQNLINDLLGAYFTIFDPSREFSSISEELPFLSLSLPFNSNMSFRHTTTKQFVVDDTQIKDTSADDEESAEVDIKPDSSNFGDIQQDRSIQTTSFSHSLPFSLRWEFLSFSLGMNYGLTHNHQSTKFLLGRSADDIQLDDLRNTRFSWNWSLNSSIGLSFFREFEFLNLSFSISAGFSKAGVFDDITYQLGLSDTEVGESITTNDSVADRLNISAINLGFLKSSLSFSGLIIPIGLNDNDKKQLGELVVIRALNEDGDVESITLLKDVDYLLEQKKSPNYTLSFNTNLLRNTSFSMSYTEKNRLDNQDYIFGGRDEVLNTYPYPSLFGGKGDNIRINLGYTMNLEELITNEILLKNLNFSSTFIHYFDNFYENSFKNNSISFSLGLNMDITSLWTMSISYSVQNRSLWRYTDHPDNTIDRGFFEDILMALSFWDSDSLTNSFWKINNLSFSLYHNLASWDMNLSIIMRPQIIDSIIIFQPSFSLSIILRDLPDLSGGQRGGGEILEDFVYDRY